MPTQKLFNKNAKTKKVNKLYFLIALITLLSSLTLISILINFNTNDSTISSEFVADKTKIDFCKKYSYKHDELFKVAGERKATKEDLDVIKPLDSLSYIKSLINEEKVDNYTHSKDFRTIAYVQTDRESFSHQNGTSKVYLSIYPYSEKKLIFSFNPTYFENAEYSINLEDLGLSNNDNLLIITTSDSIYLYNISSQNLSKIFNKKFDLRSGVSGVFSYYNPVFSEDDSKVLINKGYYEGRGALVYDFKNQKLIDLPYMIYGSGEDVIGWRGDKLLVYKSDASGEKEKKGLYLLSLDSMKEDLIFESEFLELNGSSYANNQFLSIYETREQTGIQVCDNQGKLYSPDKVAQYLYSFDLNTLETKELLKVDATYAWGGIEIQSVTFGPAGKIYIVLDHSNSRTENYLMDSSEPNYLIKLNIN